MLQTNANCKICATILFLIYIYNLMYILYTAEFYTRTSVSVKHTKYKSCHRRCSAKKLFIEISQNSPENTCARARFIMKSQAEACNVIKKRLWHRCFSVNFANFLWTTFLQNTSGQLLLKITKSFHFFLQIKKILQYQI